VSQSPSPEELTWRQFTLYTDLYKSYITAVIQLSAFVFAVSGGMVSYLLAHSTIPDLRWSLLLPMAFNVGVVVLYFLGLWPLDRQYKATQSFAQKLNTPGVPSYLLLWFMLWLFSILHALSTLGMLYLFFWGPPVATPTS
jgi:hypothetical protein